MCDIPGARKIDVGGMLILLSCPNLTRRALCIPIEQLVYFLLQVQLVANGQLAVEAVQTRKHDMILMDLQMPVLDGLSATKAIRALGGHGQDVPIYALTADVLTKSHGSLDAMGLDGYLTKPINWQSLSQVIENVVSGRRPRSP